MPWDKIKDRDERYKVNTERKKEVRKAIESAKIHEDADSCWRGK